MFKESNVPHPLFEAGLSSYEGEASPSPSEGGDVFPQNASFYLKEPLFHVKRAFPCLKESLSLHGRNAPFVLRVPFPS